MEFKRRVPWYQLFTKPKNVVKVSESEATELFNKAEKIYYRYVDSQPIDEIQASILESGTQKDRFNSYKVMAQDTPLLMLDYLKRLNELMRAKPRVEVDAMNCATIIYTKSLLPNRTLCRFADQIMPNPSDRLLLVYYFEDRLKFYYGEFVKSTERAARATQSFVRNAAIKNLGELMKHAPENEMVILNILIDKFGDPLSEVYQVASHAIYNVLKANPAMNSAVAGIIKKRMANFTEEAGKKRALKFLGQLKLKHNDKEGTTDLLHTVKENLIPLLNKKGKAAKADSKVITNLLKSVETIANDVEPRELTELVAPLYAYVERAPILTALPSLHLLYLIHNANGEVPEKFYLFFYRFFNSPEFGSATKLPQVLNFLLDVLKEEKDPKIACNFIHRLLHIAIHMNVQFTISVLYFTAKLFKEKPQVREMITKVDPVLEAKYNFANEEPTNPAAAVTFPWILNIYMKHYHPTVVALATSIAKNTEFNYDSDPFADFKMTTQLNHIAGKVTDENEPELVKDCFKDFEEIPNFEDEDENDEDNE